MSKKVKELMSTELVNASVPGHRDEVLDKMHSGDVSCVPVVERGTDRLVGIVARSDLLKNGEEEQIALIMTRGPVTVSPDDPVEEAAKEIIRHTVRRLPVVEGEDLVGMLSVADLVGEITSEREITDYFNRRVCAIWEEAPIRVAATTMKLGGDDAALVLDGGGNLTGILSDTDLVRSASIDDYVRSNRMGSGDEDDEWTWEGFRDNMVVYHGVSKIDFPDSPVKEIMTRDVITKYEKSTAADAAATMAEKKIEQMPVVDEADRVVGLLRDKDLIPLLII